MTNEQIILLTNEVMRLQDKYDATGNGLIRDKLAKKRAILRDVLKRALAPRDPQQVLFEAK